VRQRNPPAQRSRERPPGLDRVGEIADRGIDHRIAGPTDAHEAQPWCTHGNRGHAGRGEQRDLDAAEMPTGRQEGCSGRAVGTRGQYAFPGTDGAERVPHAIAERHRIERGDRICAVRQRLPCVEAQRKRQRRRGIAARVDGQIGGNGPTVAQRPCRWWNG
jgi:hypothetical protein